MALFHREDQKASLSLAMASTSAGDEGLPQDNGNIDASETTQHHSNVSSQQSNLSASQQQALSKLLSICSNNNVPIHPNLRLAILGEELYEESVHKGSVSRDGLSKRESLLGSLVASHQTELEEEYLSDTARKIREKIDLLERNDVSIEARVVDGKYEVRVPVSSKKGIETVASGGGLVKLAQHIRDMFKGGEQEANEETKVIMEGINLFFEEGKMYLVLGAPGCGKSTLLKMIANLLPCSSKASLSGSVTVNGVAPTDSSIVWSNVVAYVDQIDRLHGYLTVQETLDFAYDCRQAGTHNGPRIKEVSSAEIKKLISQLDEEGWMVNLVLGAIGLTRVKDTFVGNDKVRGVSGGQRKRVTVGEMMCVGAQVQMFDEISTGLDASTTFDIVKLMGEVTRMKKTIKLVSLLQPPPETVALFDEIILLDKGRVLFAGPVDKISPYFKSLGYVQPDRMDLADWLQCLPTKDGANFLAPAEEGEAPRVHLTNEEFVQKFNASEQGEAIDKKLKTPVSSSKVEFMSHPLFRQRYANSTLRSIQVVFRREFLLWWRDVYQRKARVMQDLFMGIIVGTVFWQTDDPLTVIGVIFQCVFFISMGAMLKGKRLLSINLVSRCSCCSPRIQSWTTDRGQRNLL